MNNALLNNIYTENVLPLCLKTVAQYPLIKERFDTALETEYKHQVAQHDEHIQALTLDFLNHLAKKHQDASTIIREMQRYSLSSEHNQQSEFNKFITDSKSLISEILATKNDMSQPFSLYVIGAGKAGKSTLINALVGLEVATVGVLPKTWKIDRFFNDRSSQAIIHYEDGTPAATLSQHEATTIVEAEEKKRKESEKQILKKRREHYALYPNLTLEAKEGVTQNLNDLYLYRSNIREVEWAINIENSDNSILNKFSIIDTPGVGQNHSGKDNVSHVGEDITAFSQADGMIWVLDATTLAAATPETILRNLEQNSAGITTTNKIAVLNRIDSIRDSMGAAGVEKVKIAAQKMLGHYFTAIIPFSAKDAFNGVMDNNTQLRHGSGYEDLVSSINQVFSKESTSRITEKANRLSETLTHRYHRDLSPYMDRLTADEQLLNASYELLQESLTHMQADLENTKLLFLERYQSSVERDIDNHAFAYLDMSSDEERDTFLSEHIFKLNDMQLKLHDLLKSNQQEVADFVTGQKKLNHKKFKRFKHLSEALYPMPMHIDNQDMNTLTMHASEVSFSSEDETSMLIGGGLAVAGMILLGPIGLLAGAADVFFGWSKSRKITAAKEKFKKHLRETIMPSAAQQIESVSQNLVSNAKTEIKTSVNQSFSYLHFYPTPENFNSIRQLNTKLQHILNQPYQLKHTAPKAAIRLSPSLTLYLLRQQHANEA